MNTIVYHIYCINDYIDVVQQQIEKVITSGLYDWCDIFEVTCIDTTGQFTGIDNIFNSLSKVTVTKTKNNDYEYIALKKIWDLSQLYDGKVLYFHTKGVSNKYESISSQKPSTWKIECVKQWKEMLEYYLITNYKKCIQILDNYDSCGVTCVRGWFWGNFWWANLSYIRKNKCPVLGSRWSFEAWLNEGNTYSAYEFYHFNYNPYFTYIPDFVYKAGTTLRNYKCSLKKAFYGTIGIQQDEGYEENVAETLIDVTDIIKEKINRNIYSIVANNETFCDCAYGKKKNLIIYFSVNGEDGRLVYNEGQSVDISFLKKTSKIIFIAHTSTKYDGHSIKIDDVGLTRRMSCMETWVPEVEYRGHEVIFFQGGADKVYFDEENKTLHLPIDESYDYNPPRISPVRSVMFERLIAAIKWVCENREFEYIFRTDDGSYINPFMLDTIYKEIEDFDHIHCFYGGAGMFFSKKMCLDMIALDYKSDIFIEDKVIVDFVKQIPHKDKYCALLQPQYVLGENLFTIHYTNGKRMYFCDYTIKQYFNNGNTNNRKLIINYPIDSGNNNSYPNTWKCSSGTTPSWYSYTTNFKNWEHYGKLVRSDFEPRCINPFGKNSCKCILFFKTIFDISNISETNILLSYFESINKDGEIIFFIESENELSNKMFDYLSQKFNIQKTDKIQIRDIVNSVEILPEYGILIKVSKHEQ